jgi:hypothetical protein
MLAVTKRAPMLITRLVLEVRLGVEAVVSDDNVLVEVVKGAGGI